MGNLPPHPEIVSNQLEALLAKVRAVFEGRLFQQKISQFVNKKYMEGLESTEAQFNMNFLPNDRDLKFLMDYLRNTMGFHTESVGNALRGQISQAILNQETTSQLKTRIRQTLGDSKFKHRLKTVLRTEGLRAGNAGQLDGARQSGLPLKKYLSVIKDPWTSDICEEEDAKYGKPEQAIPLDQEFVVRVKGSKKSVIVRAQAPPFHPNCRSVVRFIRTEAQ